MSTDPRRFVRIRLKASPRIVAEAAGTCLADLSSGPWKSASAASQRGHDAIFFREYLTVHGLRGLGFACRVDVPVTPALQPRMHHDNARHAIGHFFRDPG